MYRYDVLVKVCWATVHCAYAEFRVSVDGGANWAASLEYLHGGLGPVTRLAVLAEISLVEKRAGILKKEKRAESWWLKNSWKHPLKKK